MKTITSNSGKKEAQMFGTANGIVTDILQVFNNGIEIEKDFFMSKTFSSFAKAEKWALSVMN